MRPYEPCSHCADFVLCRMLQNVSGVTAVGTEEMSRRFREVVQDVALGVPAFEESEIRAKPKKGHFNRTFGGVGRKHYQR